MPQDSPPEIGLHSSSPQLWFCRTYWLASCPADCIPESQLKHKSCHAPLETKGLPADTGRAVEGTSDSEVKTNQPVAQMPALILNRQPFRAGRSEFSQYTARQVIAAIHEAKSKHRSHTLQAPLKIPPLV